MTRAMKKCITLLTVISLLMGVFLLPAAAVEDVNIDNDSRKLTEESAKDEAYEEDSEVEALSENIKVGSRFWELFFGSGEPKRLIASGDVFGVKIKQSYASIVDAPGVPALRCGDYITAVNNIKVHSAREIKDIINSCKGESVSIEAMRGREIIRLVLVPKLEGGEYQLGITLRDTAAGIGTITFIDPESGEFGGLGHGICEGESGQLIPISKGSVVDVNINGVIKGKSGDPGELRGYFNSGKIGSLFINNDCGVFGNLAKLPDNLPSEALPIALKEEIKAGKAYIYTTLDGRTPQKYEIEISNIKINETRGKCFTVTATDKELINKTGGIVQGMSGSPIIQNGKLIGAVTHVLINDPTTGYGIFIENMLNAAQMPMQRAA